MEWSRSRIVEIANSGEGTRIEIDFVDALEGTEGLLVGNTASGLVHVLAENRETATYPRREFRVNAGALHQYVYLSPDKTCYLSEVRPGAEIRVFSGSADRLVHVGRVKQEKRPMLRIVTESGTSVTLQDADSVHVRGDAEMCVKSLQVGDEIMVLERPGTATHIGQVVEQDIEEF